MGGDNCTEELCLNGCKVGCISMLEEVEPGMAEVRRMGSEVVGNESDGVGPVGCGMCWLIPCVDSGQGYGDGGRIWRWTWLWMTIGAMALVGGGGWKDVIGR